MQSQEVEALLKKAFDLFDYDQNETVNPKV